MLRFFNIYLHVLVNNNNSYLNMFYCKLQTRELRLKSFIYFCAVHLLFIRCPCKYAFKIYQRNIMDIKDICNLYTDLQISEKKKYVLYSYDCALFPMKRRLSLILFSQMSPVVKSVFVFFGMLYRY